MNTLHKLNIPTTRGIVLITLVNRDDFDIPAYALKRGKNRDYFAPYRGFLMTSGWFVIANVVKQSPTLICGLCVHPFSLRFFPPLEEITSPPSGARNDSSLYCHCERSEAISAWL